METPTTKLKRPLKSTGYLYKFFDTKSIKVYLQNTLALLIVIGFLGNISFIIYRSCNGVETDQISLTALTSLSTLCGIVINYYFGSSESSRLKDGTIKELKSMPSGDNPCN